MKNYKWSSLNKKIHIIEEIILGDIKIENVEYLRLQGRSEFDYIFQVIENLIHRLGRVTKIEYLNRELVIDEELHCIEIIIEEGKVSIDKIYFHSE